MTAGNLFFSTQGRIGRGGYWAGILSIAAVGIVGGFIVVGIFGAHNVYGPNGMAARFMAFLISVALFYPAYCVMAKRFQDRDESPSLALIGLGIGAVKAVLDLVGLTGDPWHQNGLDYLFMAAQLIVGLWYLIALGCLRGTVGDNRHGPDPVSAPVYGMAVAPANPPPAGGPR